VEAAHFWKQFTTGHVHAFLQNHEERTVTTGIGPTVYNKTWRLFPGRGRGARSNHNNMHPFRLEYSENMVPASSKATVQSRVFIAGPC
jgi:hypothetical protein